MRCLLIFFACFVFAATARPQGAAVKPRPVSETQWKKATTDLDYSKDQPKPQKEPPKPVDNPFDGFNFDFLGGVVQALLIILAVLAIAYGIHRMLQEPRNRRIARDGAMITEENLDTYLHETDLDRFLREALARGDYPQALRVRYLQVIKNLSESGAILWATDKTNRDYLREMRAHPHERAFQQATRTYERIWYGNTPLDRAGFESVEPMFTGLLEKTKPTA
ncbi:MAG: DUF4129 domain-containing protein [Saprospiraceae bacterium]